MKSTTFALVAAAVPFVFAAPYEKRQAEKVQVDWVTDWHVKYVTADVTEYYTGPPAAVETAYVTQTAAAAPAVTTPAQAGSDETVYVWTVEAPAAPAVTDAPAPAVDFAPAAAAIADSTPAAAIESPAAAVEAPAAQVAAPVTNYGPGPYSIDTGSGYMSASVGAKTGASSYNINDGAMQASLLNSTNYWRSEFQAAPLTWNYTLQAMAQENANQCQFEHSNAGQNLAAGYAGPEGANDGWAGEYTQYNFGSPDFSEAAGHFTQVVWQDTTSMGCAAVNCGANKPAQGWYLVCNYFPVGNMLGEFGKQVKPKSS